MDRHTVMIGLAVWIAVMGFCQSDIMAANDRSLSASSIEVYPTFLKAEKVAVLNAQLDGVITHIHSQPQVFVNQNDVLVEMDSSLVSLQIARIQSQIKLSTSVEEARIGLEYATDVLRIVQDLYNMIIDMSRVSSEKELKESKQRKEIAELGTDKAKLELELLHNDLARNKFVLEKHRIRAPMKGVLVPFSSVSHLDGSNLKRLAVGESVRAGQVVMAMMKVDRLRVSYSDAAERLESVRLGQKALVYVKGIQEPLEATVVYKSPTITVGDLTIEVEFANSLLKDRSSQRGNYLYRYRPGMKARVEIPREVTASSK